MVVNKRWECVHGGSAWHSCYEANNLNNTLSTTCRYKTGGGLLVFVVCQQRIPSKHHPIHQFQK